MQATIQQPARCPDLNCEFNADQAKHLNPISISLNFSLYIGTPHAGSASAAVRSSAEAVMRAKLLECGALDGFGSTVGEVELWLDGLPLQPPESSKQIRSGIVGAHSRVSAPSYMPCIS